MLTKLHTNPSKFFLGRPKKKLEGFVWSFLKRFTWRQRSPFIQRRLDYWLISDVCQDDIEKSDIIPSINSDHSAIFLHLNSIDKPKHGPSFWKFNASLVNQPTLFPRFPAACSQDWETGRVADNPWEGAVWKHHGNLPTANSWRPHFCYLSLDLLLSRTFGSAIKKLLI